MSKPAEVHLVEGRRSHNICIELSGIHLDVTTIRAALQSMRLDAISSDALLVLQRSVPSPQETGEIRAYLAGTVPLCFAVMGACRDGAICSLCTQCF